MKLWQIAALLAAGIAVGVAQPHRFTALFGQATLYVFLPALLFEAAWQLDAQLMRAAWLPIVLLAFPGVLITATLVGSAVHAFGGTTWAVALLLGAVLSATDPVAVVAIFRRLPVPRALATIVESESLFNDAVAVVVYGVVLAELSSSLEPATTLTIAAHALLGVVLGVAIGITLAYLAALALRRSFGVALQSCATFLAAYAAYFIAQHLNLSGIFAVLACAIVLRELERRRISVSCRRGVERVWHDTATIANALLFFLLGAALDLRALSGQSRLIAVTLIAVLVARCALAYGLLQFAVPGMRRAWLVVVRLAGVRGALSLALAIAIPAAISGRDAVVDATFAVVVVTLLVSSLTYEGRVRRLDLG